MTVSFRGVDSTGVEMAAAATGGGTPASLAALSTTSDVVEVSFAGGAAAASVDMESLGVSTSLISVVGAGGGVLVSFFVPRSCSQEKTRVRRDQRAAPAHASAASTMAASVPLSCFAHIAPMAEDVVSTRPTRPEVNNPV